jgi:hypothetical protein
VGEPVEVRIVGLDEKNIKTLPEKLGKLADNLNNFFETSFTQSGRLKVSAIPIPIGVTEEMVESLRELPDLIKELTQEIKELKETIKAEKKEESEEES